MVSLKEPIQRKGEYIDMAEPKHLITVRMFGEYINEKKRHMRGGYKKRGRK